jgi:SNF family Na+-dependent transporter
MGKGTTIGLAIFVVGIIILLGYGLYQGFENLSLENIDAVIAIGVGAIIIGLLALLISIVIEQQQGKKKMKEEIKKEDLEP